MPTRSAVTDLARMRSLARYDLFDTGLAGRLAGVCRRTAERLDVQYVAVHAVLDTATAVLATNGGSGLMAQLGGVPNEMAVCPAVVDRRAPLVIGDLLLDEEFRDNLGVRRGLLRAYAGVPILLPDGQVLGSHCVSSLVPRAFSDEDVEELTAATAEIVDLIVRHPAG